MSTETQTAPVLPPQNTHQPPPINNGFPRPAPTHTYNFKDYTPNCTVSYIRSLEQANSVLRNRPLSGPLGFDLEWRPTYRKGAPENPVALIQLANDHSIMLFQVSSMQDFPLELKQILECSQIVKAGVGIQGDARKLFRDCNVSMRNCVDLSLLARSVDNERWSGSYNSPIGLARLIACYEYKLLLKGKISRSDWTSALNSKQQEYAGNDAHAGYTLYRRLEAMVPLMPSLPKAAWYSFNIHQGVLCNDDGLLWVPENPEYDPGPPPEPKPLTEAQFRRKIKQAEDRAAQQASCSSRVESVDSAVSDPSSPISKCESSTIYPFEHRMFSTHPALPASNSMPTRIAPTKQVSGYPYSAGKQTTPRNNSQDQRFQSSLTNRSRPVGYPSRVNPQNTAGVSQPPSFPGKRRAPPEPTERNQRGNNRLPHSSHMSNRFFSVDHLGPPATHVRGNP